MNKVLKGLVAVVSAAAMAIAGFAGAASAMAANPTGSITVAAEDTHTYSVYQIFTGTYGTDGSLGNVEAGKNFNTANKAGTSGANLTAAEAAKAVSQLGSDASDSKKLETINKFVNLDGEVFGTVSATKPLNSVPAGYYLAKDSTTVTGDDAATLYIVQVIGNKAVSINRKVDKPTFQKKVQDINDSTDTTTTGWQDSADYDIGDDVPFQLKATLPSNYAEYKTYYLAFHDVEETKGLSFNDKSVKVAVDGTPVGAGYTLKTTGLTDGCTFEIVFTDLKTAVTAAKAGSEITVEYTSKLTEGANLGYQGNLNQAKLQFSNNPNSEQGGENTPTGETPWDNVIVFTYKVVVNKVDEGNQSLQGAAFKLEKKIKDAGSRPVKEFPAGTDTSFTFSGLDDGDYVLTETTTPAGYNTIEPITFTVTAEHKIEWTTTDQRTDVLTSLNGNKVSGDITFTADKNAGSLTANVVNHKGSYLPETGGMGTKILYAAGVAIVLVAAFGIVFAVRRRNAR
ncbi:MAG: isopeptide-forming domain-containing fimbrial protein [Bifidobacteriaceae bacterium]|nr:isopeptide-forming domain-containing fimbrial protein [Bifidobacteriaceae bacterium]